MGDENKDLSISSFARQSRPKAFDFGDSETSQATSTTTTTEVKSDAVANADKTAPGATETSLVDKAKQSGYNVELIPEPQLDEDYLGAFDDRYKWDESTSNLRQYIDNTAKPKPHDKKQASRARLFGGIGDALMALADGITLSQGGYINKRDSALDKTNKVIEQQKALNAKQLLEYTKGYNEALRADNKAKESLGKQRNLEFAKYYLQHRKDVQRTRELNAKAQNEANKALGQNIFKAETTEYIWQMRDKIAQERNKRRSSGGGGGSSSSGNGDTFTVFIPSAPGSSNFTEYDLAKVRTGTKQSPSGLALSIIRQGIALGLKSADPLTRDNAERIQMALDGKDVVTNQFTGEVKHISAQSKTNENIADWVQTLKILQEPSADDPSKTNFEVILNNLKSAQ
jgi:hypothetical protein